MASEITRYVGFIVVVVLVFVLQAIGFVTPYWLTYDLAAGGTIHWSIWYLVVCPTISSCWGLAHNGLETSLRSRNHSDFYSKVSSLFPITDEYVGWEEWQYESTICVAFCLLGVVLTVHAFSTERKKTHSRVYSSVALVVLVVSGVLGSIPVGFAVRAYILLLESSNFKSLAELNFPWSAIVFGVGTFMAFVAGFILFVRQCRKLLQLEKREKRRRKREILAENGIISNPIQDVYLKKRSSKRKGSQKKKYIEDPAVRRKSTERDAEKHKEIPRKKSYEEKHKEIPRKKSFEGYQSKPISVISEPVENEPLYSKIVPSHLRANRATVNAEVTVHKLSRRQSENISVRKQTVPEVRRNSFDGSVYNKQQHKQRDFKPINAYDDPYIPHGRKRQSKKNVPRVVPLPAVPEIRRPESIVSKTESDIQKLHDEADDIYGMRKQSQEKGEEQIYFYAPQFIQVTDGS